MHEIHLFLGEGTIGAGNSLGFEPGGRHRVMLFVRQPAGSDHDFALATKRAEESGLLEVKFEQGGTFQPESIATLSPHLVAAYQRALSAGTGIIVYAQSADPKPAGPAGNA
jgi:hypothetical protein